MAYGLKYIREYTNVHDATCRLEFWQKDYRGASQEVSGSKDSFVLAKEIDDFTEPIQAQPATIELLTEAGFSVDAFYSEDDEEWLIKFFLVPFGGIQKQVFYTAIAPTIFFSHTATDNTIQIADSNPSPGIKPGQTILIYSITYTITKVDYTTGRYTLHVAETVDIGVKFDTEIVVYDILDDGLVYVGYLLQDESADAFISYDHFIKLTATDNLGLLSTVNLDAAITSTNLYQYFTILEYFQMILAKTGLQLPIQVFANIYETTTINRATNSAATFADQTRLYSGTFADEDGRWQSCFDVLSAILKAFGAVVCQRHGKWVIYRYGELPALNNTPFAGTEISADFTAKSAVTLPNAPVLISDKTNPLIGGSENIQYGIRPYKYVQETFTYNQPSKVIKNLDLQDLGNSRGTSTVVRNGETITLHDYDAPLWFLDPVTSTLATTSYFIRVEYDSTGIEIARYLVCNSTLNGPTDYVTVSSGMYVNKGDKIKVSGTLRVPNDPGSSFYELYVSLFNGVQRYWLSQGNNNYQNGQWVRALQVPIRSDFNPSGADYTDWHVISVDSLQIPIDGWLNIRLGVMNNNGGETDWKDISVEYHPYINESTQITGHTHTQTQSGIIKNNEQSDRTVDDSPRNLIAGTLLTNVLTNFIIGEENWYFPNPTNDYVTKTKLWSIGNRTNKRLGEITSFDLKQIYSRRRIKLDCSFIWTDAIDVLSTFQIEALSGLNFRFAAISSINYASCTCKAVLVEVWQSGEGKADVNYEFKYLYSKS